MLRYVFCVSLSVSLLWSPIASITLSNRHSNLSKSFAYVSKQLTTPLQDISHLNLFLRAQELRLDADNIYTRWFLEQSLCPLSISAYTAAGHDPLLTYRYGENYAVVVNMSSLLVMSERFMNKASTCFFILADEGRHVDRQQLYDVLHLMWQKNRVYKNYILSAEGVLIYDPFEYDAEKAEYGQIKSYLGDRALTDLLFNDMRGYPVKVQIFRSVYSRPEVDKATGKLLKMGGVDGNVAKILQKQLNFSFNLEVLKPHSFGSRYENGSYDGAIGSVINNKTEICVSGFFIKDYMVQGLSFTAAVYDDQVCLYVPKAQRIPQSILPILSVGSNLWLAFILTGVISSVIWCLMRAINLQLHLRDVAKFKSNTQLTHQVTGIFINTLKIWVRIAISCYPPFYSERIFLASLFLMSVIFGALFESSLSTVYIHPMYFRDINTLQELDDSGLRILYKFAVMADDLFVSDTSPMFASLNRKLTFINNLYADLFRDIADNGGYASVTRKSSILLESLDFILSEKIWMVPECPRYYLIAYALPKDSPLEIPVNNVILNAAAAGLIGKWISDMYRDCEMKRHIQNTDHIKVLEITDLQLAFYVLAIGSSLGAVSLLLEIMCSWRRKKCC